MLFGAAIGSYINNIPVAILLAFLSHYLLDFIPHIDYSLKDTHKKGWVLFLPNISKIILDICSGIIIILIFSKNYPIIYICTFFSMLPDSFTVLNNLLPNKILESHFKLHNKIHFLKDKKISNFWRILSQILIVIISIIMFKI